MSQWPDEKETRTIYDPNTGLEHYTVANKYAILPGMATSEVIRSLRHRTEYLQQRVIELEKQLAEK